MEENEKYQKLLTDPKFIAIKRFNYDLDALLVRYPEEVPDNVIAQALMIEESEVAERYEEIILKLRELMRV